MTRCNLPRLHAYGRLLSTPFGLLGVGENALSFALASTFQACPELLLAFLRDIGIFGTRRSNLAKVEIHVQRYGSSSTQQGITDIEIRLPGYFHVIVEAKVGLSVPTIEQCQQYLPRFVTTNEPFQRLIAIVESSNESFVAQHVSQNRSFDGILTSYNWIRFLPHCIGLISQYPIASDEGRFARWFYTFLDREFHMKAFSTEVWILPVNTGPLWPNGWSFLDTHLKRRVYYDAKETTVRPLYITFRADGQVTDLHRVTMIEHGRPIIECVPELGNMDAEWPKLPCTIWHLDAPIPLKSPIPTGGSLWQRRVRCDFDIFLTSKTVKEIEDRMRERRTQVA